MPYSETECVYRHTEGLLTNTTQVLKIAFLFLLNFYSNYCITVQVLFFSQMDVEKPDLAKFPLFASAHVYDCVVDAGESLFIPKQFWHHVRSLDPSISISCWFQA